MDKIETTQPRLICICSDHDMHMTILETSLVCICITYNTPKRVNGYVEEYTSISSVEFWSLIQRDQ